MWATNWKCPKRIHFISAEETTVHNEFIFTAMEVGVFGWLVFFGFIALMYAAARRAQAMAAAHSAPDGLNADFFIAVQVAMVATLVFGVQVDVFHFPLKGWWLLASLAFAQYRVMAEAQPPGPAAQPRPATADAFLHPAPQVNTHAHHPV